MSIWRTVIPKMLLYSQLKEEQCGLGRPLLRYKDTLKRNLKRCNIPNSSWEATAEERMKWKSVVKDGVKRYEEDRLARHRRRREQRKRREEEKRCKIVGQY